MFPRSLWRDRDHKRKRVFLTFDDGPVPEQTPWVLDLLDKYDAKATFFCVGDNVRKHPDIFQDIVARGHTVGNHTFNHLPLFKVGWAEFSANVDKCQAAEGWGAELLRAPHGHMTPWHAWILTVFIRGSASLRANLRTASFGPPRGSRAAPSQFGKLVALRL